MTMQKFNILNKLSCRVFSLSVNMAKYEYAKTEQIFALFVGLKYKICGDAVDCE